MKYFKKLIIVLILFFSCQKNKTNISIEKAKYDSIINENKNAVILRVVVFIDLYKNLFYFVVENISKYK